MLLKHKLTEQELCEDRPMPLKSFYIHWQQYAHYFV